ncbi:MAG: hypothetical protein FJW53_03415 [Actinobacteria bacterium]|nr:hypothetical protein [Actinomycetota bacterium]
MSLPRVLTIMGSGETSPTMVSIHRRLVARLPEPVRAIVLDTPYGFQENAPELAARAVDYFRTSVNIEIAIAGLLRLHDTHLPADPLTVERGLRAVEESGYVFSGPGSPTYALRQWAGTPVRDIISDKLRTGGIVTFASAAALTLGRVTVPVYEIYKVGADVARLDGLDILGALGIDAAVIPHWDNAEGGHHDTRFCYLGATRLAIFESILDDTTWVLGVDEHTALVIDIDAGEASVAGNGTVTVKCRDHTRVFPSGESMTLDYLRDPWTSDAKGASTGRTPGSGAVGSVMVETGTVEAGSRAGLGAEADRARAEFDAAIAARDSAGALRACLALEQALHDWSGDTTQSDDRDRARSALRSMITALGNAAAGGVRDPREVVGPFVESMLEVRRIVRAEKRYDLSDVIRDAFTALGVEVRDTAGGVEWELRAPE